MLRRLALTIICTLPVVSAQNTELKQREQAPPRDDTVQVDTGTHILLSMINSVSTKQAQLGDKIYLETAFPIFINGKVVIPQGSWVTGRVTQVKRPGHVKGKGELQIHFDSLTLRNGVSRNFNSDLGALDASQDQTLNHEQSKVTSASGKKTDTVAVIGATTAGTVIGSGIGAASGHAGMGAGVGAGAGAAAGLIGTLLSRGPEAMLPKGSTVEMVLDRPLIYTNEELALQAAPSGFGSK